MPKTYSAKPSDVTRQWFLIDAADDNLGRVASAAAKLLLGKHKAQFTHHIDTGDYVVIVNAANLKVSGAKLDQKNYYRHSGYPGGLHSRSLKEQLELDPTKVIIAAVRGMLPTNKLRDDRLNRLKVYADNQHPHDPQKPTKFEVKEV